MSEQSEKFPPAEPFSEEMLEEIARIQALHKEMEESGVEFPDENELHNQRIFDM